MKSFRYVVIGLVLVLAVLALFLVREYIGLRRASLLSAHELWLGTVLRTHGPVTVNDIGFIRSWMTFDYINKLFGLPPGYLENRLSITDPRYPQISLENYAEHGHIDLATLIGEIDLAIRDYFANATSTQ